MRGQTRRYYSTLFFLDLRRLLTRCLHRSVTDINPIAIAHILNGKVYLRLVLECQENVPVHLLEVLIASRQVKEGRSASVRGICEDYHVSRVNVDTIDGDTVYLVGCQCRESNCAQKDSCYKNVFQFHYFSPLAR